MKTLSVSALYFGVFCGLALAGPPMICHPLETRNAPSLPWSSSQHAWDGREPGYDRKQLVADTLSLLNSDTPVIARMETLRRAAIYADSPALAIELSNQLVARTKGSDPMAAFDAGYFIEAVHQLAPSRKSDPLAGKDGYALAKLSLARANDTAALEYGLSLMVGRFPNDHFRKAKLAAKQGSLLAQNLQRLESW